MVNCGCFQSKCRVCPLSTTSEADQEEEETNELPVSKRRVTDVEYFNILIVFLTFLTLCISVAFLKGDSRRLMHGHDDNGNVCGVQNDPIMGINKSGMDYRSAKFLLINKQCKNGTCLIESSCVDDCANGKDPNSFVPSCRILIMTKAERDLQKRFPLLERISLDLIGCWRDIGLLLLIGICFSVLPIFSLRYIVKTAILSVLIFVAISSFCGFVYLWVVWGQKKSELDSEHYEYDDWRSIKVYKLLTYSIILTFFLIIYFIMLFCLKGKIKMIITLFEEASNIIFSMPLMFVLPIMTHIMLLVLCFCFILSLVFVQTSGAPTVDMKGRVSFPVGGFFSVIRGLMYFGFVWCSQFFLACQSLIVSASVAKWYFKRNKENIKFIIPQSFILVMTNHLGTAAFASILLTIAKPFRVLYRVLKTASKSKNWMIYSLWFVFHFLLEIFESMFRSLNKNAYAMTILYSEDFCPSSRRAMESIASTTTKISVVDGLGTFVLMIIELCVSVGVSIIAITIFQNVDGLENIWVPVTLIFVFTFLFCHSFTSIYEMTIETLFICFLEDSRCNDGVSRPYYMSRSLAIFMQSTEDENSTEAEPQQVATVSE